MGLPMTVSRAAPYSELASMRARRQQCGAAARGERFCFSRDCACLGGAGDGAFLLREQGVDSALQRRALGALGCGGAHGFAQLADFGDECGLLLHQLLIDGQFFIDLDLAALAARLGVALSADEFFGCKTTTRRLGEALAARAARADSYFDSVGHFALPRFKLRGDDEITT